MADGWLNELRTPFWESVDPRLIYVKYQMIRVHNLVMEIVDVMRRHYVPGCSLVALSALIDRRQETIAYEAILEMSRYFVRNFCMEEDTSYEYLYRIRKNVRRDDVKKQFHLYYIELTKELVVWHAYIDREKTSTALKFIYERLGEIARYFSGMASIRESEREYPVDEPNAVPLKNLPAAPIEPQPGASMEAQPAAAMGTQSAAPMGTQPEESTEGQHSAPTEIQHSVAMETHPDAPMETESAASMETDSAAPMETEPRPGTSRERECDEDPFAEFAPIAKRRKSE